jgi:hypothetical protein
MGIRTTALAALLLMAGISSPAFAQAPDAPLPPPAREPGVDVSKLPLDLDRLQRKLRQSAIREDAPLRFTVDVFGQAPPIVLVTPEDNLRFGPAPYGAPTHRDMIDIVTPKEFSSPIMDFGSLIRWFDRKSKDKK